MSSKRLAAFIYLCFFGVIGGAIFLTKSPAPLWALLLFPSYKSINKCPECGHTFKNEED